MVKAWVIRAGVCFGWLLSVQLGACDAPGARNAQTALECTNGVKDGLETAVDCGGGACAACGDGSVCLAARDCASGACEGNLCVVGASCTDRIENGDETGVDCGGSCSGCPAGQGCVSGSDCLGGVCDANVCAEAASCSDAQLSPGETDIDCGGACRPCAVNKTCEVANDCQSQICTFGTCRDPSCTDALKNQDETDVDCGGNTCGDCLDGKACLAAGDCVSGRCSGNRCSSCSDGEKNGDETAVDCGGQYCDPCSDGQACASGGDCTSGSCANQVCRSCSDGKKNGDETGIDCGGSCAACNTGTACGNNSDCSQGICENSVCCIPNACGQSCGAPPVEVCNGRDDDCNGQTDDGNLGQPPLCPNQLGVCAGVRTTCDNGWVCTNMTFAGANVRFESGNEYSCDGLDNDCDGQTDEGLRNACGGCGAVGPEVCDGVDNDCDGMTDEVPGCSACLATPTLVRVSPVSGTDFGGPPQPGSFLARNANTVWSVHSEPRGDDNRLYITRFVDGASATRTLIDASAMTPTMALLDDFIGVVARADFNNNAKRFHRIGIGAGLGSSGIEIVDSSSPATTTAQRFFLTDPDTGSYCDTVAGFTTIWDGSYEDFPQWSSTYGFTYAGDMHFFFDGEPGAVRNTASNLFAQDLKPPRTSTTLGPAANSVELSTSTRGEVVVFDVDVVTGVVRAYYIMSGNRSWRTGTVAFPAGLRFLGADIVTGGPIIALALDASDRLVGAVLQKGANAWTTVTYQAVSGIRSAATSEVSVDDAGRIHLLTELSGASPERLYMMACPTCPGGVCAGASGPIVLNEVLYDTVGADNDVFVELRGTPGQSLVGYSLVGIAGDTGTVYRTIALSGTIPASGLYLVATSNGNATLRASAQLIANVDFQNGPDGIALRGPEGETIDALAYAAAGASIMSVGEGTPALAPAPGQSLARTNGVDTNQNAADFTAKTPTPGAAN